MTESKQICGADLLRNPQLNRADAFTQEERDARGLRGLLPPAVSTMELQVKRTLALLDRCPTALDKFLMLDSLHATDEDLYFKILIDYIDDYMPVVYTPTVGEVCQKFSHIYRYPRGAFISINDKGRVREIIENCPNEEVDVIVVTDGQRILGLGDLGINGMGIPCGKLSLYTACAGIAPEKTLPVTIDVGTNNPEYLNDPMYLGLRQERVTGEAYDELIEEFVTEARRRWPNVLIQFEDFGNNHAFDLLERYKDKVLCFNDDIQGTAAVAVTGVYSALRVTKQKLADQRFLFLGAGEAATGIAELLVDAMVAEGVEREEALKHCFLFDSKGLVTCNRGDKLAHNKVPFAHDVENCKTFIEAVRALRPTGIIGVAAQPGDVVRGPSVTRYEFTLSQGVKLSKITNLQDDIALALGASGVRIAPIPDKISVVGVEVPNKLVSPVSIRTVLESTEFTTHPSTTAFAVGKDISGKNIVGNISKLPHVLIAGTTGSGKSVCTNSLIVSMLYKSTPEEVRFIMVDPKMVELAPYNGIPHLLIPVVTDPKKAAGALQWAVYEMMKRYKMFSEHNVKDLASYNKVAETDETLKKLPSVVVVIDELADLMLVAAKEVEESICRVAQMGRAAGMHLVIATQRPSADVITGLMKANIPSRIAFAVASAMESRIILDTAGAEKLVGRGDMLYAPLGEGKPKRVQGCFISSEEIERVVNFVKENGETEYDESVIDKINAAVAEKEKGGGKGGGNAAPDQNAADDVDELLPAAIDVVMETGQASVSMLQRRLKLGYSRAARIVDEMETRGIVGPFEGSKPRQLLITKEQWQELKMKGAYGATPPEAEELPPPDEEN